MSDLSSSRNSSPYEMYKGNYGGSASALTSSNRPSIGLDTYSFGDKDYDIIGSYNFILRVEGFQNIPLKAVRGINKQNEYEYIQEGGLNDYIHMVRKPISQPFTFQVERYVSQDWLEDAIDPLANGTELVLPLLLYMYRSNAHDFTAPSRYYIFNNCRVTGVQIGDLDAEKSGLHTITNTIAYAQMTIVTIPFAGSYENYYRFNNDGAENKENTSWVKTLKDIGITRMGKPLRDNAKSEEVAEAAEKEYRGNRTKVEMATLGEKYAFKVGNNSANTDNLENTVVQKNAIDKTTKEEKSKKYKFGDPPKSGEDRSKTAATDNIENAKNKKEMQEASKKYKFNIGQKTPVLKNTDQANTMNIEGAKSKEDLKSEAQKYKFKNGTKANNVSTQHVASTKPKPLSKKNMESIAAKNKYEISLDKKNANNINTENVVDPEKVPAPKEVMEAKAKRNKYVFKKGDKANSENKNAVDQANSQLSKDAMKGKARQFSYGSDKNTLGINKNEIEAGKKAMEANAEMYNRHPHYEKQEEASRLSMENKARRYPPTRSARDVTEFLNRNR